MKIYIYGSKSFKKHMNSILLKANLASLVLEINDADTLEQTVQDDKLSIYLIDSDKIINKTIITEKLNFLKPKDSIYKCILMKAGIEDICFNSDESLIEYIEEKVVNYKDIENENNIIHKERDMSEITQIDEIFEEDLLSALDTQKSETFEETKQEEEIDKLDSIVDISNDDISNSNELVINSTNIDDVTSLIKELLNNKTLELSIKIKAS